MNGIGLKNYFFKGYGSLVIHSEYMVQLAEGGVIGAALFLLFNQWIARWLFKLFLVRSNRALVALLAGAFISILFIDLTAWTYQFSMYFVMLGVVIGYIRILRNKGRENRLPGGEPRPSMAGGRVQ